MNTETTPRVALVTGAAHRIGAAIACTLHAAHMNVVLHYRSSGEAAVALAADLNAARADTARTLHADLQDTGRLPELVAQATQAWGRLDALVNNASLFEPTAIGETDTAQWETLMGVNLKAPFFLSQAAAPELARRKGSIVNLIDIHAERPLAGYPIYSISKAGLVMLTRSLAVELGPRVRVNGISPGAILWPDQAKDPSRENRLLSRTPLTRTGNPEEIAETVRFLVQEAGYITGQVINVDGGRSVYD